MKRLLFLPVAILIAVCCRAQSAPVAGDSIPPLRPVTSAYMLEIGSSSVADSYLSPITYRGWNAAFAYERMQAMKFDPDNWVMQLNARIELDRGRNHADNATTWRIDGTFSWGMLRRWHPLPALTIAAGGSTGIDAGCIYNPRNSNNPASAKLAWTVNATAYAAYNLRVGRLPVTLRYQPVLPLAGIFFAPEYDELYYEIYLGNRHGLVHCAWPGSMFRWDNLVTADLDFATTRLRVGFRSDIFSSEINHITTRIFSYAFVLGVTGDWFSVSARRGVPSEATTKFIYAY